MNSKKLTIKDSSLGFLVGFLFCQLATTIATVITLILCHTFGVKTETLSTFFNTAIGYLILSLSLYSAMVLVFLFFNSKKDNTLNKDFKLKKLFFYITISAASFLCLYPIVVCFDSLLAKLGVKINTLPYSLNTKNYFISIIPLVVAPAVCEELLFRGIIFQGLKHKGKVLAITLSSLMFSIYHMSLSQTLYPLLIGLLLGVIMFYEQNIYYCIATHMTNNFLSLTLSYFKINLVFNHWAYLILAIVLAALFVSLITTQIVKNRKATKTSKIEKNEKLYLIISFAVMIIFWIISNLS